MSSTKLRYRLKLVVCYVVVLAFFVVPLLYKQLQSTLASSRPSTFESVAQPAAASEALGTPSVLTLPQLKIRVSIAEGVFEPRLRTWVTPEDSAAWIRRSTLVSQGRLNEPTVIYGHNTSNIFKNTLNLALSDELVITTVDGTHLLFTYSGDKVVQPASIDALNNLAPNTATLITCTGKNDSLRRLMTFDFKGQADER